MEQQDRIMDGDLQTLGLQSILKMLTLSGKSGKLFVSSGPETLSISLRKGQIVGLHEDGVPQPDLLGMLCLIGRLDPVRAQAIREMAQGDMQVALMMLVEQGWMNAAEMQRRLGVRGHPIDEPCDALGQWAFCLSSATGLYGESDAAA